MLLYINIIVFRIVTKHLYLKFYVIVLVYWSYMFPYLGPFFICMNFLHVKTFWINDHCSFHRLTDNLVALKEIRLEHEEGAPCTAIREGK